MNEHDEFVTSPADAILDKHLLALQRLAPRSGFEDRVLARVSRRPPAVVRIRKRAESLVTARRLWWASGLAAASSTAWTVGLANWLSLAKLQAAVAWLNAEVGLPLASAALQGAAIAGKAALFYTLTTYGALGNGIFPLAAVALIAPVLSGWGLYLTVKQPRGKRIPAYAVR